jgi:hypothetical protein
MPRDRWAREKEIVFFVMGPEGLDTEAGVDLNL